MVGRLMGNFIFFIVIVQVILFVVGCQPPLQDAAQGISTAAPASMVGVDTELPVPATAVADARPNATQSAAQSGTPTAVQTSVPTVQAGAVAAPIQAPTLVPSPQPTTAATFPPTAIPTTIPTLIPPAPPKAAPATPTQERQQVGLWRGTAAELAEGKMEGVTLYENSLLLAKQGNVSYPATARLTTAIVPASFPFNNAVMSWNAIAQAGTGLRFELRTRVQGQWTPWYVMGVWEATGGASQPRQRDEFGEVEVDTLELSRPADAWQGQVTFQSKDGNNTPSLSRLALAYADLRQALPVPLVAKEKWAGELPVPAYSQVQQDPAIAYKICSPTSLTMILNYYGKNEKVADVAYGVQDHSNGIFGNWPLNTAYAASLGFESYVARFDGMNRLQQEVAAGRPVAISIRFEAGQLSASPIASTGGHLIVVRGFTANGDVIVNDPMGANPREVRRVYSRQELEKVWLSSGGVAYIISPVS